jgi:Ca2+-transporting ATPase
MNLVTDSLPSLALSVENEEKNIMKRKPINPKETILKEIWGFVLIAGVLSCIITMALFLSFYKLDLEKARTIAITAAIFCEMFVVISCRSEKNIGEIGLFSNKFLIFSVIIAILLQMIAVYTPLSALFGFEALSISEIALIAAASSSVFIFFELKKLIAAKSKKN